MRKSFFHIVLFSGLLLFQNSIANASYTCRSSSNGRDFTVTKMTARTAIKAAVSRCQDNRSTANSECQSFTDCNPGRHYYVDYICQSMSNGYAFTSKRAKRNVARNYAISRCQDHRSSANSECRKYTQCHHIDEPVEKYFCSTESNGYQFEFIGWNRKTTRGYTISRCQDHRSTSNSECRELVECAYAGRKHNPQLNANSMSLLPWWNIKSEDR